MRSLGWTKIQQDSWAYKKEKFGHRGKHAQIEDYAQGHRTSCEDGELE